MKHESAISTAAIALPLALVERSALASALAFVSRIPERKGTIPILANARLRAFDGGLRIEATDMDMSAVWHVPGAVDSRFDVTVPARLLHDTLKGQSSELVEVRPVADPVPMPAGGVRQHQRVSFDFEGQETTLNGMPACDFPEPAIAGFTHRFTVRADMLRRLLDKTAFAISTEETRYYLNGVYLHVNSDDTLFCVATDGHRLARAEIPAPDGAAGMPGVIVPRKAVAEALRLIPKGTNAKPSRELVTVSIGPSRVRFQVGDSWLDTKVIDGHFPDYQRVIPTGNDKILRVEREAFAAAVKAVMAVSNDKSRGVKLSITDGLLEASRSDPDNGCSSRIVEAEFNASDMEVGFNAKYLLDILGKLESEAVTFLLSDPGSPALIFDTQGGPELYVLMPMRV